MSKIRMLVVAGSAGILGAFLASARQQNAGERLFSDVLSVVSSRHLETMERTELLRRATVGLLDQLNDPYAHLYPPSEQDEFRQLHQGNYGGVGMTIEDRDGIHVVVRVFQNTPAERAGFHEGDRILAVNDSVVRGWPIERVTGRIKGEPGSRVTIEYDRGGGAPVKSTVTRAVVRIPAVPYAVKIGDVGYIPLIQFGETASEEVAKALDDLKQQGAKSFVLDLRGNGGGLLDEAVEISDLFLPDEKTVVVQRERQGSETYKSRDAEDQNDAPLVVLVDQGSASASEIVAGALQDHDRALIVGDSTYGKGVVQTVYRVGGNNILKLTTGEWLTPAGRSIHRKRERVDGQWTVAQDSTERGRTYRSDSGRPLKGHGGIAPDMPVANDTLTTAEQTFVAAIRPRSTDFYLAYTGLAAELKDRVKPGFTVEPQWLDDLYARMQARNLKVAREQFDGARRYVSDLLAMRIARNAFGDAEAKRLFAGKDLPLSEALKMLRENPTQRALLSA
ncbi:MAG: S41 family peptidase, partial [Longimicrobiales bacterium]